jgi:hypothetical protein
MLRSLSSTIRALGSMPSPTSAGLAETVISVLRVGDGPRRLISSRSQLRRSWLRVTLPIGLLLGVILSLVNQGGMLLSGQIDVRMCVICALDFMLPLAALSALMLAAASWAGSRS